MIRLDLFNFDTAFWRFVLDILEETTERPHMMPVRVRQSFPNVCQILEYDYIAVVFDGFRDEFVGDRVNILFPPCSFSLSKAEQSVVRGLCPALLHFRTSFLELSDPVVVLITAPERTRASDGETVHTKVDTEDCLVLGLVRSLDFNSVTVVVYLPSADVEGELVGCVVLVRNS